MKKIFTFILPYLALSRVHVLTGKWFVIVPSFWGLTIACQGFPPIKYLLLLLLAAFLVSAIGCTMNDIVDKDIDKKIKRTQNRPLASGLVTVSNAIIWLGIQSIVALFILSTMNKVVWIMAIIAVFMIFIYPWLKRITYWPQLFLGFAMNYSMLMAYAFVKQRLDIDVIILYIGSIFWTLAYDTVYAHQDKKDDLKIGVKSLALLWGNNTKLWISISLIIFMLLLFILICMIGISWLVLCSYCITIAWTIYQLYLLNINDHTSCAKFFKRNNFIGLVVWLLLIVAYTKLF